MNSNLIDATNSPLGNFRKSFILNYLSSLSSSVHQLKGKPRLYDPHDA